MTRGSDKLQGAGAVSPTQVGHLASRKAPRAAFLRRDVCITAQASQSHCMYLVWPEYLRGVVVYAYMFFFIPAGTAQKQFLIHVDVQHCIVAVIPAIRGTRPVPRLLGSAY